MGDVVCVLLLVYRETMTIGRSSRVHVFIMVAPLVSQLWSSECRVLWSQSFLMSVCLCRLTYSSSPMMFYRVFVDDVARETFQNS